jgi:hypothetical protein
LDQVGVVTRNAAYTLRWLMLRKIGEYPSTQAMPIFCGRE